MANKPIIHPTLYRRGAQGKVRFWYIEQMFEEYRSVYGLVNGDPAESGWTLAEPKNIGKTNETTAQQQADLEIKAEYEKKLERDYFEDIEDIDTVPFVKPMLAHPYDKRVDKIPAGAAMFIQPKLDGIRCIAREEGLWTRQGKRIVACPHIEEALAPMFDANPELILDGELYNHDLRDDFNEITSIVRKSKLTDEDISKAAGMIQYHVYDVVDDCEDFETRTIALIKLLGQYCPIGVIRVPTKRCLEFDAVDTWYSKWLSEGYEGQMVRLNIPYQRAKRSTGLLKRKEFIDMEFCVHSVQEGNGNWRGAVKQFTCILEDGRTFGAGVKANMEEMTELLESGKTPDWATVRYFTKTPAGIPRFPVVVDYGFGSRQD